MSAICPNCGTIVGDDDIVRESSNQNVMCTEYQCDCGCRFKCSWSDIRPRISPKNNEISLDDRIYELTYKYAYPEGREVIEYEKISNLPHRMASNFDYRIDDMKVGEERTTQLKSEIFDLLHPGKTVHPSIVIKRSRNKKPLFRRR